MGSDKWKENSGMPPTGSGPPGNSGGKRVSATQPGFEELLSRYLDDELSPELALQVETCLQEEPEAMEAFERFSQTRELLRSAYKEEVERVDYGALWSGIEAGIANIEPSRAPVRAGPGILEQLRTWWKSLSYGPLGLGVAVTAALLLTVVVMRPSSEPGTDGSVAVNGDGGAPTAGVAPTTPAPVQVAAAGTGKPDEVITDGVEVNDVAGGADATVMVISSPDNATIIWVNETEGQGGSSI